MTISRVRRSPGGVDDNGDPIASTETATPIVGAFVAPRVGASDPLEIHTPGRAGVIVGLSLFAPYGTDLVYTDEVDVDGARFEVEGEVGRWRNGLTGTEAGIEVALRRAAG